MAIPQLRKQPARLSADSLDEQVALSMNGQIVQIGREQLVRNPTEQIALGIREAGNSPLVTKSIYVSNQDLAY